MLQYCTTLAVFGTFSLVLFFVCFCFLIFIKSMYSFTTEYYKSTIKIYASCVVHNSTFNFRIETRLPHHT